jgi:uncharacterized RDD family membrane protein YckC
MGSWGRLVGFAVALLYFGVQNSKITGGQTMGKRVLRIKVVAKDGSPLSLQSAFIRFLPLGAPWFLNNAQYSEQTIFSPWAYVISVAVFGVGLSVVYLYIFNRKSRQSLHDLLVGSYVVPAGNSGPVVVPAVWNGHFAFCVLIVAASAIMPYFTKGLIANEPFASLISVYSAVDAKPWVVSARVTRQKNFTSGTNGSAAFNSYNIVALVKDSDIGNAGRAKELADLALSIDSSSSSVEVIQVTLVYGYDIGIASSWRSQTFAHSPDIWRAQ